MQRVGFLRTEVKPTSLFFVTGRGITRPRVFDWNRDGNDDLVMGTREIRVDRNLRAFDVDAWLQTVEKEQQAELEHNFYAPNYLRTTNVTIPEYERLQPKKNGSYKHIPVVMDDVLHLYRRTIPTFVEFADWDGDGNFDLLTIIESYFWLRESTADARVPEKRHTVFWLRNKTSTGEPEFDAAQALYQIRGDIVLQSFTIIDWDDDGSKEIVVSVAKKDPEYQGKIIDLQLQLLAKP